MATSIAYKLVHDSFRDQKQRERVATVLLSLVGVNDETPDYHIMTLPPGRRALVPLTYALCIDQKGDYCPPVQALLVLEGDLLEKVGELFSAMGQGPAAIEGWVGRYGVATGS